MKKIKELLLAAVVAAAFYLCTVFVFSFGG